MNPRGSALERLHEACAHTLPDGEACIVLTYGDVRAIRARLEELERALHGGRDRDGERREFVRSYVLARVAADNDAESFADLAEDGENCADLLRGRGHL